MSDHFPTPGDEPTPPVTAGPTEETVEPTASPVAAAPWDTDEPPKPSGWHRVNIGHLVMGLAFLCFVGAWGLVQGEVVTGDDIRWLLPIPWLVAGAAGLIAVAIASARRHGVRR